VKNQKGITTIEYLVVAISMAIALLMPVPGNGGRNAAQLLMEAIKGNHHAYVWGMSMPL
jgi:competence protein ComGC